MPTIVGCRRELHNFWWGELKVMRIAVSGASGLIGSRLCLSLRRHEHEILPLIREGSKELFGTVFWNHAARTVDMGKLERTDVVIHLAGKPLDQERWTTEVKKEIYASRIQGTAFLSEALTRLKVPPHLMISASASDH